MLAFVHRVFSIRQHIVQMDDFALKQRSSNDALSSRRMRNALEELFEAGREFVDSGIIVRVAVLTRDRCHVCLAQ